MVLRGSRLLGFSYELGELEYDYSVASGYRETVDREQIPDVPDLWGWGRFFETKDPYGLGSRVAVDTLTKAQVDPGDVELTILSCSYFPHADETLYRGATRLLGEVGLSNSLVDGQTLAGCATLISALQRAVQVVEFGMHDTVLVVGIDCLPGNEQRFWNYALFSDAAAGFLVSRDVERSGFRALGTQRGSSIEEMSGSIRFDGKSQLHVRVLERLLAQANASGTAQASVKKVFGNNVFLPIKSQKDKLAGWARAQRFAQNVPRTGHCLACDSVINLVDHSNEQAPENGTTYLLQADGNGICAAALLEWVPGTEVVR